MDITRTKQKKSKLIQYWPWALVALPVMFATYYLWFLGQADFSVDSTSMVYGQVEQGEFTVSVRGSGILVPDHVQWLATNVDARVERLIVKAGKIVKKGDLIVELSNPQLAQKLEETKWELEALEAETIAARVSQESTLLNQKSATFNAKLDYESSKLKQDQDNTKFEIILGGQPIAKCVINKKLSDKEYKEFHTLANVYINQKRHVSLSSIDQLTGVLNRQAFNEKIKLHCRPNPYKNRRQNEDEKCLALLDIDHFKKVNDNFGHLIGDEVLVVLGQKLNHAFRDDDLCFRYGGEEFAVILSNVNLEQAMVVLERFRKTILSHKFPQVGEITISIGLAQYTAFNQPSELISKADKALYYAKDHGRNQVISYHDLLEKGLISPEDSGSDIEFL